MAKPMHFLMLSIGIGPLLFATQPVMGQPSPHSYIIFTPGAGAGLQGVGRRAPLQIQIPYTITDANGVASNRILVSTPKVVYPTNRVQILPFDAEIGGNWFGRGQLAGFLRDGQLVSMRSSIGGGFNWYLSGKQVTDRLEKSRLVLQVSINLVHTSEQGRSGESLLASIDNTQSTIGLFGTTYGPTFTTNSRGFNGPYSSNHFDINYAQNEWAITPMISLMNNPLKLWYRLKIDIGYSIPFSDKGTLHFYEDDGGAPMEGDIGSEGSVKIGQAGMIATYNGKVIHQAPYRFNGFYILLTVAFYHNASD